MTVYTDVNGNKYYIADDNSTEETIHEPTTQKNLSRYCIHCRGSWRCEIFHKIVSPDWCENCPAYEDYRYIQKNEGIDANRISNKEVIKEVSKVELLKKRIERIKEERDEYVLDFYKLIKTDRALYHEDRSDLKLNKRLISFILERSPDDNFGIKNKKRLKNLLDDIEFARNGQSIRFYSYDRKCPFTGRDRPFYIEDLEGCHWEEYKRIFDFIKSVAMEYLEDFYNKELISMSIGDEIIICESCGKNNQIHANYCNYCGSELK